MNVRSVTLNKLLVIAALIPLMGPAYGDKAKTPSEANTAAKRGGTAEGHPYFGGIWANPYGGHREGDPQNPKLIRPPLPVPKLKPQYQALTNAQAAVWEQSKATGLEGIDADSVIVKRQILCLPYGMPTEMAYNMSFDIQQSSDRITIVGELDRAVRRIWLDRPQQSLNEVDPGFWGRSVGHWEGNTLVVNTIGIKTGVYGENFMAHSDQLSIEERMWLQAPDILYIQTTLTDPLALDEPYKTVVILTRAPKDYEPSEFVCDQYPAHMIGPDGKMTINKNAIK